MNAGIAWGSAPWHSQGSGVQTGEVLVYTRSLLNDDECIIWPDHKLLPKLRLAHRIMQLSLIMNGVPIVAEVSLVMPVPANTTDCSTCLNYPCNLIQPVWMKERMPGQRMQDFVDMTEVDYLPQIDPSTELIWWNWNQQTIQFIGAVQDREVYLRYRGGLRIPQEVTDSIGPFWGELYLAYKTAALAASSLPGRDAEMISELQLEAQNHLEDLLGAAALEAQNLPAKRRPYHRGRGRSRVLRDF